MSQTRTLLTAVAGAGLVALVLGIAWRSHRTLVRDLPPKVECATETEAREKALRYIVDHGGSLMLTSGTPSMQPYIIGRAYGVFEKRAFAAVPVSKLILYHPVEGTLLGSPVSGLRSPVSSDVLCHILAARDSAGGIPSGLGNARSESWGRVTEQNFVGEVVAVFTWPQ